MGRKWVYSALSCSKWPIHQFKLVQQSRHKEFTVLIYILCLFANLHFDEVGTQPIDHFQIGRKISVKQGWKLCNFLVALLNESLPNFKKISVWNKDETFAIHFVVAIMKRNFVILILKCSTPTATLRLLIRKRHNELLHCTNGGLIFFLLWLKSP